MPYRAEVKDGQVVAVFVTPDEPYMEAKPEDFKGWKRMGSMSEDGAK